MPFLILLLGAIAGGGYWYYFRARDAVRLIEMADDVRLAARRFQFRRNAKAHPADTTEDPRPLGVGVIIALAEIAGPMTERQIVALNAAASRAFGTDAAETGDIMTFGRWLAGQCGGPDEAARRLTRRVRERAGPGAGPDLLRMAAAVLGDTAPTDRQAEARQRLRRDFAG